MKTHTNVLSHTFLKYINNENLKKSNCGIILFVVCPHKTPPFIHRYLSHFQAPTFPRKHADSCPLEVLIQGLTGTTKRTEQENEKGELVKWFSG